MFFLKVNQLRSRNGRWNLATSSAEVEFLPVSAPLIPPRYLLIPPPYQLFRLCTTAGCSVLYIIILYMQVPVPRFHQFSYENRFWNMNSNFHESINSTNQLHKIIINQWLKTLHPEGWRQQWPRHVPHNQWKFLRQKEQCIKPPSTVN